MRVMLGLSGGVDSAVAAYLLKEQGYEVICCFMRNWDSMANNDVLGNPTVDDNMCPQEKDYQDACKVAESLGLPMMRIDFVKEYWDNVFTYFLNEYEKGRTPNPDIFCNKYIKFDAFYNFAKKNNCDMIAMGHYAKRVDVDGKTYLYKAKDLNKDQTYFLSQISLNQLKSCLFPLGDITKDKVREIAHKLNLISVEDKKDSTGICFIGERNFKQFLQNYIPAKKGNIVDIATNRVLGIHDGVMYYTLGQRKGLGIGGIKGEVAKGWFVCKKDVKNNILYVASGKEDEHLFSDTCIVNEINLFNGKIEDNTHIYAKFRYRQKDLGVTLFNNEDGTITLKFDDYYKAVTPGQACVLYDGDICLGGGIIDKVYYKGKLKNY
ncbi:MAG: tRNA 2-thiouridine(34) synthase MnmA [Mollicutes bacterium]|nr:tRNA 2-thiouridine(34) synthase MnmA [Mollicutes bacterium]MDD7264504.1 tRNA 2-thiouridine(34) synthase MnmA [bacterium]MDY4979719.1 tRNA 2-thiouridine(34) synthase MnmA [Candidatus Onthovivens sp.]